MDLESPYFGVMLDQMLHLSEPRFLLYKEDLPCQAALLFVEHTERFVGQLTHSMYFAGIHPFHSVAGTSWYYIIPPCTWSYTCTAPSGPGKPCVHSMGTWEALTGRGRFHEAPLPCKLGFQHQQSTGYLRVQGRAIHCPASRSLSLVRRPMGYGWGDMELSE